MSLPPWFSLAVLLVAAAFISGFFYGRSSGRQTALQSAVTSFQLREKINNETESLSDVAVCVILGGLRDECAAIMRGMDQTAAGE